jgi:hypothetical protein
MLSVQWLRSGWGSYRASWVDTGEADRGVFLLLSLVQEPHQLVHIITLVMG